MGIDIRNGQQLECITCALCIDACDTVMDRVGLPKGLISYTTFKDYDKAVAGSPTTAPAWRRIFRLRTVLYFAVWIAVGLAMFGALSTRSRLDLNVLHDRNPLYTQLASGDVRNGYDVKTLNMVGEPREFRLSIEGLEGATFDVAGFDEISAREAVFTVEPDVLRSLRVYITAPAGPERREFDFVIEELRPDGEPGETDRVAGVFHGPSR
jgi:polyferredoxin